MSVYPGNLLTVTAASVRSSPASTRTWEWLRNGVAIPASTTTTYRVTEEDIGSALAALQKETNFLGFTSATSLPVGPVEAFSPSVLFEAGEQGAWFDPSDVANLNWRRNLLTWTEQFDNAVWNKSNVTISANADAAPDGTMTADLLYPTSTGTSLILTGSAARPQAISCYAKASGKQWIAVGTNTNPADIAFFNLQTGVVGAVGTNMTSAEIQDVGSGWYRVSVVATASAAGSVGCAFFVVDANSSLSVTASGTSGILLWGAQLELGSVATDYQRISDVNTEVIARFPTATLYQDTRGTTPVTTPGQAVALMLDKSKGLVLGTELAASPVFSAANANGTVAEAGGIVTATCTTNGTYGIRIAALSAVVGASYQISVEIVTNGGSKATYIDLGGLTVGLGATTGSKFGILPGATNTAFWTLYVVGGVVGESFSARVSSISVKELPGNHAVQSTGANRPIYAIEPFGGRRNLLTWSQDVSNAVWVGANGWSATNSTTVSASASGSSVRSIVSGLVVGQTYTLSMDAQKLSGAVTGLSVDLGDGGTAFLTLPTASVGRLTVTRVVGASGAFLDLVANGAGSFYLSNIQLELGSTATAYQRVTTQYDVTEAGVPSVSYLSFNGMNFSMSTSSINFATVTSDGQPRRNLLTVPTLFDDPAWAKTNTTVTANTSLAPDGTTTADTITEDTATSTHLVRSAVVSLPGSSTATFSVYAKPNGRTWLQLANASYGNTVYFDLSTGAVGNTSFASGSAVAVGNGWYRCSITFGTNAGNQQFDFRLASANGTNSYTGNGTSGVLLWGAQLELGTTATAFQNIGTDKMTVFGGVRKLSDAARGTLTELGVGGPLGSFGFFAPSAANAGYNFVSTGGSTPSSAQTVAYAAPITNVLTGLGNISGDTSTLRVDGTQIAQSTIDQGPGNYTTQPLFIGARAGTSLFFNGHLYSLIVRGAQSSSGQITGAEAWVQQKTPLPWLLSMGYWQDASAWNDNSTWNDGV